MRLIFICFLINIVAINKLGEICCLEVMKYVYNVFILSFIAVIINF